MSYSPSMTFSISPLNNLLTFVNPSGKAFSIKAGTVVNARVIETAEKGMVTLRIDPPAGKRKNAQGMVIKARSDIPMTRGQNIYLEVIGGRKDFKMRFIGVPGGAPDADNIPTKLLGMLAGLSGSRLSNSEFKLLLKMLKFLPESIKAALPELKALEKLIPGIKQLNGKLLKASVDASGVVFETRLKLAIQRTPGPVLQSLLALQAEGDLKGVLLRLRKLLKEQSVINALRQAGFKVSDTAKIVDGFIKNIEFFQLTSRINDMLCTFLPVSWEELKDGEFLFRKNRSSGKDTYTCNLTLDLETLGKLSISVTVYNKAFYVTFMTEKLEVRDLINSERQGIQERFASRGLLLKMITINQKQNISFEQTQQHGINLKA